MNLCFLRHCNYGREQVQGKTLGVDTRGGRKEKLIGREEIREESRLFLMDYVYGC